MIAFMSIRHQQNALVFLLVILRVDLVIGNFLKDQLVKTACASVSYADNYVVHVVHVKTLITELIPSLLK